MFALERRTRAREAPRRPRQLGALLLVGVLLSGCATGTPVGFRVAASGLHPRAYGTAPGGHRRAPSALARTNAGAVDSPEGGEACGEPVESGPSAEATPAVHLEPRGGVPPGLSGPVSLNAAEVREALAGLILQVRLTVGSRAVPASAGGGGEALDRLYQHVWRDAGLWCQAGQSPREDGCLSLLERGFSLDRFDRLKLAVGFSLDTVLDGVAVAVGETFSPKVLAGLVAGFLASYVLMLAAPEPVFTKGLALVLTVYLAAYLGTGPFRRMVLASRELVEDARQATTFAELEEAGHRFGLVLGEDGARVVLLLLMAALGDKVYVQGHKGPHPQAYHEAVYENLRQAMRGCGDTQQCRESLTRALEDLAREISTDGTYLHKLLTE